MPSTLARRLLVAAALLAAVQAAALVAEDKPASKPAADAVEPAAPIAPPQPPPLPRDPQREAEDEIVPPEDRLGAVKMAVNFKDTPLVEVLEQIGDKAKVDIIPLWPRLEALGYSREIPITFKTRRPILARTALNLVLRLANSANGAKLVAQAEDDVLVIDVEVMPQPEPQPEPAVPFEPPAPG